jgi:predicted DsbA family dithiol-disulfide isomerase
MAREFAGKVTFERHAFLLVPNEGEREVYDDYIISHRVAAARAAPELGFAIPTRGQPYPRSSVPQQLVALLAQDRFPEKIDALEDELFRSVFVRLEDVASREALERCVEAAGLPRELVAEALADPELKTRAIADHVAAGEFGISGIPALVVPGWGPIVGAVPIDVYRRAIGRAVKAAG